VVAVIADGNEGHLETLAPASLDTIIFIVARVCTRTVNRIARLSAAKLTENGELIVAESLDAAFEKAGNNVE